MPIVAATPWTSLIRRSPAGVFSLVSGMPCFNSGLVQASGRCIRRLVQASGVSEMLTASVACQCFRSGFSSKNVCQLYIRVRLRQ